MKKLIAMMTTVATVAMAAQAASVSWQIGEDGFPGKQDGSYAQKSVYLMLATPGSAYDSFVADLSKGTVNAGNIAESALYIDSGLTTSNTGKMNKKSQDYGTSYGTAYTVVFVSFDSINGDDYYYLSGTKTASSWGDSSHPDGSQTVAKWTDSNYKAANWHKVESVPEPTSGLLLILGMAGLALRRRRV